MPEIELQRRSAQLSQVLLNLLNNSYDAIENLEEKWVSVSIETPEPNRMSFVITDSGKGIPSEVADRMMQPFFTTKEVGKGTGLGLSISKGIIEDHGGKFTLDRSCPNTRFIISLPITQPSS